MRSIIQRVAIAILACIVGLAMSVLVHSYSRFQTSLVNYLSFLDLSGLSAEAPVSNPAKPNGDDPDFDLASEISLERINDGCLNCGDRRIVFRRDGSKKFEDATVTELDLHSKKERRGRLSPYYFNNLLRLIKGQDYFGMNGQYAMGWVDSMIVTVSVGIGDKHKTIRTTSEGDVPVQLWGIYYAIEGVSANVSWETNP